MSYFHQRFREHPHQFPTQEQPLFPYQTNDGYNNHFNNLDSSQVSQKRKWTEASPSMFEFEDPFQPSQKRIRTANPNSSSFFSPSVESSNSRSSNDFQNFNTERFSPSIVPPGCKSLDKVHTSHQRIFDFEFFNRMQSECFDDIYFSDMNMVVSAPTGSGKTALFELAILRLVQKQPNDIRKSERDKVIYMAPIKALCQEKQKEWRNKFSRIGLNCQELTGDTDDSEVERVKHADIILTTPEKWDSITRRWKDGSMAQLVSKVRLLLIDEVHLLNEERGAVLEAVVSRMKTMQLSSNFVKFGKIRILALSATIPNCDDIGQWLEVSSQGVKRFGEEYRPCQLDVKVIGFKNNAKNEYMFNKNLDYKLYRILQEFSEGKPSLVFCSTRKSVNQSACQICKDIQNTNFNVFIKDDQQKSRLISASRTVSDKTLQDCILYGVGFHSAGLSISDRKIIEKLFLESDLQVVCTTTTLAQGVNFPAHLVVVKGTMQYKNGKFCEYSNFTVMQMIGRAGRPQFDNFGRAVILTKREMSSKYENLATGKQTVESNLKKNMIEHLNAEVVLHTITDISIAINWLKSTFFFTRMKKNPRFYNLPSQASRETLENELKEICLRQLKELAEHGIISMDEDGFGLSPTDLGKAMARFYIAFETMKNFQDIEQKADLENLTIILSKAKEYSEMRIRMGEKKILNKINGEKEKMKFPLKGKVKTTSEKIFILTQASLGNISIEDWSLKQEIQTIFQSAPRIARCMIEYIYNRGDFISLKNALILEKCLNAKMWKGDLQVTRQIEGIGPVFASSLSNAGITTLEKLINSNPRKIEMVTGRHAPWGNQIQDAAKKIPQYSLNAECDETNHELKINLVRSNEGPAPQKTSRWKNKIFFTLLAGTKKQNQIVTHKKFSANDIQEGKEYNISIPQSIKGNIDIFLICERYVGIDQHKSVKKVNSKVSFNSLTNNNRTTKPNFSEHSNDTGISLNQFKAVPLPSETTKRHCKHKCKDKSKCGHKCCKLSNATITFDEESLSTDINNEDKVSSSSLNTEQFKEFSKPLIHKADNRQSKQRSGLTQPVYNSKLNRLNSKQDSINHENLSTNSLKKTPKNNLSAMIKEYIKTGDGYAAENFAQNQPIMKQITKPTETKPQTTQPYIRKSSENRNTSQNSANEDYNQFLSDIL